MALYDCIVSNQWSSRYWSKGETYDISDTPPAGFFTAVAAADADARPVSVTPLPAWKDAEGQWHVDVPTQWIGDISIESDVFFDNISGDAGIQKFVAWNSGTGLVDIDLPGLEKVDNTTFRVYAGSGNFLDLSDPLNPTVSHIHWETQTETDPYIATNLRTAVGIDSSGSIATFADEITSADRRDYIPIGLLTHTDGATITQTNLIPAMAIDPVGKLHDLCSAVKFSNLEGNVYSGASSSVNSLAVTAGKTFSCDRNFADDKTDPNVTSQAADSDIATFFTAYSDGSGGTNIGVASVVDSTKYDDGTGTLATLAAGFWVTHRLYRSTTTGSTLLIYGQSLHKGRTEALTEINIENFAPLPGSEELILRGFLTINSGAAGLQSTETSIFTPADKWGTAPTNRPTNGFDVGIPSYKSYAFTSRGVNAGTYYAAGFYEAPATDANLTQASTTVSYGTANVSYAAHGFIVAGGAGSVDTGQVGLRANYTKIDDTGTRTTSYVETITEDITTLSLNDYLETGKVLGTIQFELYVVSGSPTTYSLDFNYGLAKYEDFGNRNFMVTDFEVVGFGDGTDTNFNIELLDHTATGWTYSAAAFVPGDGAICELSTDYSTDDNVANNEYYAYKRSLLNTPIGSAGIGGVLIRVTTTSNSTVQILTAHVGVEF